MKSIASPRRYLQLPITGAVLNHSSLLFNLCVCVCVSLCECVCVCVCVCQTCGKKPRVKGCFFSYTHIYVPVVDFNSFHMKVNLIMFFLQLLTNFIVLLSKPRFLILHYKNPSLIKKLCILFKLGSTTSIFID